MSASFNGQSAQPHCAADHCSRADEVIE